MSENDILLVGGGGHCRSCIDVIETGNRFRIAGIIEKTTGNDPRDILGYPVIGDDGDLPALRKQYAHALVTVGQTGSSAVRQQLFDRLKALGYVLPVVVSPLAHVSRHAYIGDGTIVMHRVIVNSGARIGKNCILNTGSLLEHDVRVGDHTHVSTSTVINGDAWIGSGCFVGSHATIIQGLRLPDHYFFRAGSLVTGEAQGKIIRDRHDV